MRSNYFIDFFQTETNYVGILDIIDQVFKQPLEKMAESENGEALLNKSEIKAIFGNFAPILDVHRKMLDCLKAIANNWCEDCLIGDIILRYKADLLKAYPSYINFYSQMKEAIVQCDAQNSRFHAFLKINQAKPECGRQSLPDLMIGPIQRLPRIILLLNGKTYHIVGTSKLNWIPSFDFLSDILKHTPKENPDVKHLEDALVAIKEVLNHINEDKRKTEGQMVMFDIFKEIENCPVSILIIWGRENDVIVLLNYYVFIAGGSDI